MSTILVYCKRYVERLLLSFNSYYLSEIKPPQVTYKSPTQVPTNRNIFSANFLKSPKGVLNHPK